MGHWGCNGPGPLITDCSIQNGGLVNVGSNAEAIYWTQLFSAIQSAAMRLQAIDPGTKKIDLRLKGQDASLGTVLEMSYQTLARLAAVGCSRGLPTDRISADGMRVTHQRTDIAGTRATHGVTRPEWPP